MWTEEQHRFVAIPPVLRYQPNQQDIIIIIVFLFLNHNNKI